MRVAQGSCALSGCRLTLGMPQPLRLQAQTQHTCLCGHIFTVGSRGPAPASAEIEGEGPLMPAPHPKSTSLTCPQALGAESLQVGQTASSQPTVLISERGTLSPERGSVHAGGTASHRQAWPWNPGAQTPAPAPHRSPAPPEQPGSPLPPLTFHEPRQGPQDWRQEDQGRSREAETRVGMQGSR